MGDKCMNIRFNIAISCLIECIFVHVECWGWSWMEGSEILMRLGCIIVTGLWVASLVPHNDSPPFKDAKAMYSMIDSMPPGNIPWQSFTLNYNAPPPKILGPDGENPSWTTADYDIWFHNPHLLIQEMIANPEFKGSIRFCTLPRV